MGISLRRASIEDTDILYAWRNDESTRAASHDPETIPRPQHDEWLNRSLANPNRQLYIAEEDGVAVGTVRADFDSRDTTYELSWTVSPQARKRGIGLQMVALLAKQLAGPIKAQVKRDNRASSRIAEGCGMSLDREENGVLYYRRSN
jgi:RimJ/RimL family protein N-acetyltransferase